MDYIVKRHNTYYYQRRVPVEIRPYIPKEKIRIALGTDSLKTARKRVIAQNLKIESYWRTLIKTGEPYSHQHYQKVVARSQYYGFLYQPAIELATQPVEEVIERLLVAKQEKLTPHHVEAVCGGVPVPIIKLSEAFPRFLSVTKHSLLNKTEDQKRKWRNPRLKAWRNFLARVPDKPIHALTRDDILAFRDWHIDRIENGELIAASANHELKHARSIITIVAENHKIRIDETYLFKRLELDESDSGKRPPFDHQYLISTFLTDEKLKGLNPQARGVVYAFAETGAGPAELSGLLPEDILLDHEIPHINIVPRQKKGLKTKYRHRTIPLVGHALDVFKKFPNGFTQYHGKADLLSTTVGKYCRENGLYPTEDHSLYSLRHNFQDRLLEGEVLDRVQADLMGHKFNREDYGSGSSLELKLKALEKIKLKK